MRFEDQLVKAQCLDLPYKEKILLLQKGLIQQDYADAVATLQAVADGVEACDLRDKAWAAKETKIAHTTPVQRDTDGDVQITEVNSTDFKGKKSETTGNAFAKAGTAAKRVSQEVVAGQLVEIIDFFLLLSSVPLSISLLTRVCSRTEASP
ncbi:hypothetical protein E4U40_005926 [Claviceps sp. LM458 group G5]|nr:hypothetical protein E4U40_005926 [Claviceps sp. LM458 group G5]